MEHKNPFKCIGKPLKEVPENLKHEVMTKIHCVMTSIDASLFENDKERFTKQ
jgi:hypothetical protein